MNSFYAKGKLPYMKESHLSFTKYSSCSTKCNYVQHQTGIDYKHYVCQV